MKCRVERSVEQNEATLARFSKEGLVLPYERSVIQRVSTKHTPCNSSALSKQRLNYFCSAIGDSWRNRYNHESSELAIIELLVTSI